MKYLTTALAITLLLSSIFIMGCGDDDDDDNNDDNDDTSTYNFPPTIDQIVGYGNIIKQGTSTPLQVLASDMEKDPLEYTWESTAGNFDITSEDSVTWTAPDTPGDVTITISVSDGKDEPVKRTIPMEVISDDQLESGIIGTWNLVSIDDNRIPYVVSSVENDEPPYNYKSENHLFELDGTFVQDIKYEYILTSGISYAFLDRPNENFSVDKSVNIDVEYYNITGKYSVEDDPELGLTLTEEINRSDFEASYDQSRYNEGQKNQIDSIINRIEQYYERSEEISKDVHHQLVVVGDNEISIGASKYGRLMVPLKKE